jgi:hypothetical protein
MLIDAKPAQNPDTFAAAKAKLGIGPVPDWVFPCQPDYHFTPKPTNASTSPSAATLLLWNVQTNSVRSSHHFHMALRLETMQAVQRESQWRLEFEPRHETVTLHWIKIRRGETDIAHTHLEKFHLLQREAGLEGCVIDGCFTALLLLEDVRPGDVLDWSYTIERRNQLLPGLHFAFFQLPLATHVGKLFFSARSHEERLLKWKASDHNFKPEETREENEIIWRWSRENFFSPEPEVNVPVWHSVYPWFQVSNCPDWGTIARAVNEAWQIGAENANVAKLVEEICTSESEPLARLQRALRLVQDEFRYLSVNTEHGGQIPTPPDIVARRRFGDCKDLSFLLVYILRRLGINARPVLVSAARVKTIADMLPGPNMFDHAIVEFDFNGQVRWVDVTIKNQGGGPMQRVLPQYGFGLVVDDQTIGLTAPPPASVTPGTLRIKETLLLDTTGENSYVALVSTSEGAEAEILRQEFAHVPLEELSRRRLQHCANRYNQARRVGDLKYRDDRETNEFHIAEVFEVNGFLGPSKEPGFCTVHLPANLINGSLHLPEPPIRRDPWALPPQATLVHTAEVEVRGNQPFSAPRSRVASPLLEFTRQNRCLPGYWSATFTLKILADAVQPAQLKEHIGKVHEIFRESTWQLTAPVGFPAPIRNRAFGTLPNPPRSAGSAASSPPQPTTTTPPRPAVATSAVIPQPAEASITASSAEVDKGRVIDAGALQESAAPRRRSRRHHRNQSRGNTDTKTVWIAVIGFVLFMLLLTAFIAIVV